MKLALLAVTLIAAATPAEPANETPNMVPAAEVAQATAELIAAGQRVLEERNEALDENKRLRERLFNCESARST